MKNDMEIWIDIPDFENLYQISNFGRIKNKKTNKFRKPNLTKRNGENRYEVVHLCKNGNCKCFIVHRLVAENFIKDKQNFKSMPFEDKSKIKLEELQINHIDKNKQNNRVDNLEWCTAKYNVNKMSNRNQKNKKGSISVVQLDNDGNIIKIYPSAREAERQTGISHSIILTNCRSNRKIKYNWRFK